MGLMRSVLELGRIALPVPDYSTLCRRRQGLVLPAWPRAGACIVIDSTGLQIRGPNTWLTTVHGHKRRTYRKIHLGVDPDSSLIVAGVVTPCQTHDSEALEAVLETADLQESAGSDWRWRLRPAPMLCRGQETRSAPHYSTSDWRCPTWRSGIVRTQQRRQSGSSFGKEALEACLSLWPKISGRNGHAPDQGRIRTWASLTTLA